MNFESPKSYGGCSDENHTAADAPYNQSDESQPQSNTDARFGFKVNDFVVYPAHGAGRILAIEEKTVAEATLEFFVIYFAKSKMTLRAPTRKAANAGMRKLSNRADIERVQRTLCQTPNKARGNWSRLAQEYASKINSGNVVAVAEVMRDLYRPALDSSQSYSERQLYISALDRLSGEIALVDGISEEEAIKVLENFVTARGGRTA